MVSCVRRALTMASGKSKRYRRLDENSGLGAIARGSFGKVYVALDTTTQETVAVKRQVLPSTSAMSELCWYKALSQARHPNVMHLLDHFVTKGVAGTCLYMVFEFMDTNLWHLWKKRRRVVPTEMCFGFVSDLVHGLSHLHGCDVVHTDLSMANMLVGPSSSGACSHACASSSASSHGVLRISDLGGAVCAFGIVLPVDKIISTEYVRAPEIILGDRKPTEAVDLWALGVVIMALACGSLVFWRPVGLEPSVEGLLPAYDAASSADQTSSPLVPGSRTLQNQVAFLGAIGEGVYPGCTDLPRWSTMQNQLVGRVLRPSPSEFLGESEYVRRPLAVSDPVVSLILSLLRWDPKERLPAKQCEQHDYLKSKSLVSTAGQALLQQVPLASLRDIVQQSLHSGRAVDFDSVLQAAMRMPSSLVEAAQPMPALSQGDRTEILDGQIADGIEPPPVAKQDGPKRRRLRSKTSCLRILALFPRPGGEVDASALMDERPGVAAGSDMPVVTQGAASSQGSVPAGGVAFCQGLPSVSPKFESLCGCKGNCGVSACKNCKNKFTRGYSEDAQFCKRPAAFGSDFCVFCQCERCGRRCRQEIHGCARWCSSCVNQYTQASSHEIYHNNHGTHRVESAWSSALKLTACFAWVSRLAPGVEAAFFFLFVQDFLTWRGYSSIAAIEHPGDVLFLLLVGCVRWPPLVFRAMDLRHGFEPRDATAADWTAYLKRLLAYANGFDWKDMFDLISPGRSRIVFGMTWLGKHLGIIRKATPDDVEVDCITLGVWQRKYVMLPAASSQDMIQGMLDGFGAANFRFPANLRSADDIASFCDSVAGVVDLVVGADSTLGRGYCCLKFLSLQQRLCGDDVWDPAGMSTLARVLPDENMNLNPLLSWSAKQVRIRFGMSPVSVAGSACFWGTVQDWKVRRLRAKSNKEILNAVASPAEAPMSSCVAEAQSRRDALIYIPAPGVWVSSLVGRH